MLVTCCKRRSKTAAGSGAVEKRGTPFETLGNGCKLSGFEGIPTQGRFTGGKGVYRNMQQWTDIRLRVLVEGESKRQILRETRMHWTTLEKILAHP